jgi:hypothetical protein
MSVFSPSPSVMGPLVVKMKIKINIFFH